MELSNEYLKNGRDDKKEAEGGPQRPRLYRRRRILKCGLYALYYTLSLIEYLTPI